MKSSEKRGRIETAVNIFVKEIFISLDKDLDTVLTEEEAVKVCSIFKTITKKNDLFISEVNKQGLLMRSLSCNGISASISSLIVYSTQSIYNFSLVEKEIENTQVELNKWKKSFSNRKRALNFNSKLETKEVEETSSNQNPQIQSEVDIDTILNISMDNINNIVSELKPLFKIEDLKKSEDCLKEFSIESFFKSTEKVLQDLFNKIINLDNNNKKSIEKDINLIILNDKQYSINEYIVYYKKLSSLLDKAYLESNKESYSPIIKCIGELIKLIKPSIQKYIEGLNDYILPTREECLGDVKIPLMKFSKRMSIELPNIQISSDQMKFEFDNFRHVLFYDLRIEEEDVFNKIINKINENGLEDPEKAFDPKRSKANEILYRFGGRDKVLKDIKSIKEDNKENYQKSLESSEEKEKQNEQSSSTEKLEDKIEDALEAYDTKSSSSLENQSKEDKIIEKRIILHYPINPSEPMSDERMRAFMDYMDVKIDFNNETKKYILAKANKLVELYKENSNEDDRFLSPYIENINNIFQSFTLTKGLVKDKAIINDIKKKINKVIGSYTNDQLIDFAKRFVDFETFLCGRPINK